MAEENTTQQSGLQFEEITPWGTTGGDTGLSSRLKIKRNFDRIKTWADIIQQALMEFCTPEQIEQLIEQYGSDLFLSKTDADTANGLIRFLQGLVVGTTGNYGINSSGNATLNEATLKNLTVTGAAHFFELIIDKINSAGGSLMLTVTNCTVDHVDEEPVTVHIENYDVNCKRVYFAADDGNGNEITNDWEIGDGALSMSMNAATGTSYEQSNKAYWSRVLGKGTTQTADSTGKKYHYIDIATEHPYYDRTLGIVEPASGDVLVQLGFNNGDRKGVLGNSEGLDNYEARQNAIYLAAYKSLDTGLQAPLFAYYEGIDDFHLANHRTTYKDANGGTWTGTFKVVIGGQTYDAVDYIQKVVDETAGSAYPNILLRTVFEQGLDKIAEEWNYNSGGVSLTTAADTKTIMGRQTLRLNSTVIHSNLSFIQSILGKLKAGKWYTFSFYCYCTRSFNFYIQNRIDDTNTVIYDGNPIVDGVEYTGFDYNNSVTFAGEWRQKFHTITFKTNSDISQTTLYTGFYLPYDSSKPDTDVQVLVIGLVKLEENDHATMYAPNEEDLQGKDGTDGQDGTDGTDGQDGADAIYYKLYPVVEKATVNKSKQLTISLTYNLFKTRGTTTTQENFGSYVVRYKIGSSGSIGTLDIDGQVASKTSTVTYTNSTEPYVIATLYSDSTENAVILDKRTIPVTMEAKTVFEVGDDSITSAVQQVSNIKNLFGFNRGIESYIRTEQYSYTGNWIKEGKVYKSNTISDDEYTVERVAFNITDSSRDLIVYLEVSSEYDYDFLYLSKADTAFSTSNYQTRISGQTSKYVKLIFSGSGDHFFEVAYVKDDSDSEGNDCGRFMVIDRYECQLWPYGYGICGASLTNRVRYLGLTSAGSYTVRFEGKSNTNNKVVIPQLCSAYANRINGVTKTQNQAKITLTTSWQEFVLEYDSVTNVGGYWNGYIDFLQDEYNEFQIKNLCIVEGLKPQLQFIPAVEDNGYVGSTQTFAWSKAGYTLETAKFMGMDVWKNSSWLSSGYLDMMSFYDYTIKDGQAYTLSFWARTDNVNGATIRSFLENPAYNLFRSYYGVENMDSVDGQWETKITKNWQHYSVHWTPNLEMVSKYTDESKKLVKNIRAIRLITTGATYFIAGLTFQEGYVDDGAGTISNSISTIAQNVDSISIRVSNVETTVGDANRGLVKSVGELVVSSEQISSTVSSLTDSGVNLVVNGAFYQNNADWNGWGSPSTIEFVTESNKKWVHLITNSYWQGVQQNHYADYGITIEAGQKYTLSFVAYRKATSANAGVGFILHWFDSTSSSIVSQTTNRTKLTTTPTKYSYQVTVPATINHFNLMVGCSNAEDTGEIYITEIQFEKGEIATAYKESIQESHSLIKQTADSIALAVYNGLSEVGISINGSDKSIQLRADFTKILSELILESKAGFTLKDSNDTNKTQMIARSIGTYNSFISNTMITERMSASIRDQSALDNTTYQFTVYIPIGSLLNGKSIKINNPSNTFEETIVMTDQTTGMQFFDTHPVNPSQTPSITMQLQSLDGNTNYGSASLSEINYTNNTGNTIYMRLKVSGSVTFTQKVRDSVTMNFAFDCGKTRDGVNTIIGFDGWASIFPYGHMYFGTEGTWIRHGDYMLRITRTNGIQKSTNGGTSWSNIY